jgi:hypothetical protein
MGLNSWRAGLVAGALLIAQGTWQGTAGAAMVVACNTSSLITAISSANSAETPKTLTLATGCTYNVTAVASTGARGDNGLPIITGNITLVGSDTTIRRTGATPFRLLEVDGTLGVRGITLTGGDAGGNPGGAILNAQGTVSVTSSSITRNVADNGAGLANDRGEVTLSSSTVRDNSTVTYSGGGGGGIYNDGTMTLNSSAVIFNDANANGGGIYNELTGRLSVNSTQLLANTAKLRGGGLYNGTNGAVTFIGSVVQHNSADVTGGGIYNATCRCAITLSNTRVSVNDPNNCRPSGSITGCSG